MGAQVSDEGNCMAFDSYMAITRSQVFYRCLIFKRDERRIIRVPLAGRVLRLRLLYGNVTMRKCTELCGSVEVVCSVVMEVIYG